MTKNYVPLVFCKRHFVKLVMILFVLFFAGVSASFSQATYTWNKTGTTDWAIAANWTPSRDIPAANDILQFNNGATTTAINIPTETIGQLLISNSTTINLQAAAANNTLIVSGIATGDDLIVNSGASLNSNGTNALNISVATGATGSINGDINFLNADHHLTAIDASGITFNSPATFTQDVGCGGNVFTNTGVSNTIIFNAGTSFLQKTGANPFGLTQPASKVLFKEGSLFKPLSNLFLSFLGRTYADIEINLAAFNQSPTGSIACSIDNITVTQGNLSLDLIGGVNIKGNIAVGAGATLSFNPASNSTLSFNGTTPQTITNTGTLTFGSNESVVINNANGITINNDIFLNKSMTFTAGIVKMTNPAVLTLSNTASVASVSNTSFVDGFVKKIGNTAFTFPVGSSTAWFTGYVPIQISAPTLVTDEYIAAYNRNSAVANSNNYVAGIDHVSGVDYWTLSRTSGSTAVDVTLYWTNESSNGASGQYINDKSKLVVAHYNGSTQWDDYGGVGAATGGFSAGAITWSAVNLFSATPNLFSLASTEPFVNPLPISLNNLNGHTQNSNNYLVWKITCNTAAAKAIMHIERSADGQNFVSINYITATALRCEQPFYYMVDHPLNGINYYRLKMIDGDDKITYSSIITLHNNINFDMLSIAPTLVTNTAVININALESTRIVIIITDVACKQVQRLNYTVIAGNNQFTIHLANLAAGVYQLTGYTNTNQLKTLRFVKQ